jgi:hypothetical protein
MFGITLKTDSVANQQQNYFRFPAACALKNGTFSIMMNFDYSKAEITVSKRLKKPPRMDEIIYELSVYSQDSSKY